MVRLKDHALLFRMLVMYLKLVFEPTFDYLCITRACIIQESRLLTIKMFPFNYTSAVLNPM